MSKTRHERGACVAQISSLLYRRLPVGKASESQEGTANLSDRRSCDTVDWESVLPIVATTLRHCAAGPVRECCSCRKLSGIVGNGRVNLELLKPGQCGAVPSNNFGKLCASDLFFSEAIKARGTAQQIRHHILPSGRHRVSHRRDPTHLPQRIRGFEAEWLIG